MWQTRAMKNSLSHRACCEVHTEFNIQSYTNPSSSIIITPAVNDETTLEKSTADFILMIFQNVVQYNFTSIAFPTIGYEHFPVPIDVLIRTLVREMANQLMKTDLPLTVKFITQPNQANIYDEFCKQILTLQQSIATTFNPELPLTWEKSAGNQKLFIVPSTSDEYKSIVTSIALVAGVYFSSNADYSHGYTRPNANGERCMFLARVLVGRTTAGNSSMKTPPLGFDSTSAGHAFVSYHDAQAYAEYLITYK
ncbi:unnamed protein product [Adineta ricciae]|uniref:Uncharacterized protein n=1 Tax=Adineta ricciae TaxID=249248 RepID=A0A815T9F4_ADIRI|nr:unnamed protein product [Adineta ricciae]CAF1527588.1 unnamed protein product [Adineta ricciae]